MKSNMTILIRCLDVSDLAENSESFEKLYRQLPEERRMKIDRYRFFKDRRLSLGAGYLLQKSCKEYGIPDADRRLTVNEYQKPYFRDHPEIFFNLSHSGDRILCVMAGQEIGCDIEKKQYSGKKRDVLNIAKRFFSEEEYRILLSPTGQGNHDPAEQEENFLKYWTARESFLKCLGTGLAFPLSDFTIRFSEEPADNGATEVGRVFLNHDKIGSSDPESQIKEKNNDFSKYRILQLQIGNEYCAAVCLEKKTGNIRTDTKIIRISGEEFYEQKKSMDRAVTTVRYQK